MDVRNGIATICPDSHGRVLGVLARVEKPLSQRQVALSSDMSHGGVSRALVAASVVWHAILRSHCHVQVVYYDHAAAKLICALVRLDLVLAGRSVTTQPAGRVSRRWGPWRCACPAPTRLREAAPVRRAPSPKGLRGFTLARADSRRCAAPGRGARRADTLLALRRARRACGSRPAAATRTSCP